jgi:hypothetical protein
MSEQAKCALCGEPMPPGEEMFNYHGYSGPCPKPPLPRPTSELQVAMKRIADLEAVLRPLADAGRHLVEFARPELLAEKVPGHLLVAAARVLDAK